MQTLDIDQFWPLVAPRPAVKPREEPASASAPNAAELEHVARQIDDLIADFANLASAGRAAEDTPVEFAPGTVQNDLVPTSDRRLTKIWRTAVAGFDRKAASYAAMGFVAGALAWHAIGFWGFLSSVVLNAGTEAELSTPVIRMSAPASAAAINQRPTPSAGSAAMPATATIATRTPEQKAACVTLVIDRETGIAMNSPCTEPPNAMRDAGLVKRSDRGPLPADAAAPDAASQTLTPSDVSLDISSAPELSVQP